MKEIKLINNHEIEHTKGVKGFYDVILYRGEGQIKKQYVTFRTFKAAKAYAEAL